MPFDALAMAAMTDEVRAAAGGRIQKIVQPSLYGVGLGLYASGSRQWLLLSADPRFARVQFTGRLAKAFPTPSPFVMLLRKYLDGARIESVEHLPCERVMFIHCRGGEGPVDLVCEVMGKHSNIMLVGGDSTVLGAVKLVRPGESRVRPILPGLPYVPPPERGRDPALYPAGPRPDPSTHPHVVRELLGRVPDTSVRQALLGLLPGCGPFLADQIAFRAGASPGAPVREPWIEPLVAAAASMFGLYQTHAWEPSTFLDERRRPDFSPFRPLNVAKLHPQPSFSEAIAVAVEDAESHDALGSVRKEVLTAAERALRAAERRVASLYEGLEAADEAETYMIHGQLVLAYAYSIQPQQDELVLPEMEMVIALDPMLSPAANAERLFRRYRKLRDARERIPQLLQTAEVEVERLRDLVAFAHIAGSEGDLRALLADLRPEPGEGKKTLRRGPPRYVLGEFTAIVGRNARENEEVTFRLAGRSDLWLHARERTGAHVVLQGPGEPDEATVTAAAELAAHFSEARNDTAVDVAVAPVRDVRKIPGGPPGRVTYRNARTVRVRPELGSWVRER